MRLYRLALGRAAGAFRHGLSGMLPPDQEGRVLLRLAVPAAGPPAVSLLAGSGHAALDRAALDMMSRAAAATALPGALHGRAFTTDIALEYETRVTQP